MQHPLATRFARSRVLVGALLLTGGLFVMWGLWGMTARAAERPVPARITIVDNGLFLPADVTRGTVAQALNSLGYRISTHDLVFPALTEEVNAGARIFVYRSTAVTLIADGKTHDVHTVARTVGELLAEQRITLATADTVRPAFGTPLKAYDIVRVTRVVTKDKTVEEAIPYPTEERSDATLAYGTTKVLRAGTAGRARRSYRITYADGREVSRTKRSETILKQPVGRIVIVGTKVETKYFESGLATHYGYDYNTTTGAWPYLNCSTYCAAHKTLPFGTRVKVTNTANGKTVIVMINDRGPYGPGRVIDLSKTAFSQLASPSAGIIAVRLDVVQ